MLQRPIPKVVGKVLCTIIRDDKGMNMFKPKYYFRLSQGDIRVMKAEKLFNSKTKHYQIQIDSQEPKYASKENPQYLGRLRANLAST